MNRFKQLTFVVKPETKVEMHCIRTGYSTNWWRNARWGYPRNGTNWTVHKINMSTLVTKKYYASEMMAMRTHAPEIRTKPNKSFQVLYTNTRITWVQLGMTLEFLFHHKLLLQSLLPGSWMLGSRVLQLRASDSFAESFYFANFPLKFLTLTQFLQQNLFFSFYFTNWLTDRFSDSAPFHELIGPTDSTHTHSVPLFSGPYSINIP